MLSLTRIFLYNWHRFHDHDIPVEDSIYLAGHNDSGKSLVLDAIQLVLVADRERLHFCGSVADYDPDTLLSSESDHTTATLTMLDSYVRGRVGEDRLLRPGKSVAYVALEFTDRSMRHHASPTRDTSVSPYIVAGVCIEAGDDMLPECTFVIITDQFDRRFFIQNKRPLTRHELKQSLNNHPGAHIYDQVGAYQNALRNQLGMLNERFIDFLLKALHFQPVRTVRHFIEQWVLAENPLDIAPLQCAVQRLDELQTSTQQVEEKLAMLRAIIERQNEVKHLRAQRDEYSTLAALLRIAEAEERASSLHDQIEQLRHQISEEEHDYTNAQETFEQAREALFAAERDMYQSDAVHRRSQLQRDIEHLTNEADTLRTRWHNLRRDLIGLGQILRPALEHHEDEEVAPSDEERDVLLTMLENISTLEMHAPPQPSLLSLIDSAIPKLTLLLRRTQERLTGLKQHMGELRQRGVELNQTIARLRAGQREYSPELEQLRSTMAQATGEQPPLLCELLEIPDERWQNAVEALLGDYRFTLVVQPKHFEIAVQILNRARTETDTYHVGLLDIARTVKEECPVPPGSLAAQVKVVFPALRPYIDTVLGNIITCETIDELRHHQQAVMPDVLVRNHWTTQSIPPQHYTPWFVGERANQSHIEAHEHELHAISEQWSDLIKREQALEAQINRLNHVYELVCLRQRVNEPLDERPLRSKIAQHQSELEAFNTSSAETLEREVTRLRGIFEQEQLVMQRIVERQMQRKAQLQALEHSAETARRELRLCEEAVPHTRARFVREQGEWNLVDDERREKPFSFMHASFSFSPGQNLSEAIHHAESTARDLEVRITQEAQRLTQEALTYNSRYQFVAQPGNHDEERYTTEQQRLRDMDLPRYRQHIEQTRREIEQELRDHVLHQLRDRIVIARQQFERMNDALARLDLHGEHYRFQCELADDMRDYTTMIEETPRLDTGPLFESEFYAHHQATFDHFYQVLTRVPTSEKEQHEQQRLTDYRRYLSYSISVTPADERATSSPPPAKQPSVRDTQMPFYLTIAASFLQLYHIDVRNGHPTARLVLFDKAFAMMSQDHIGAVLDLFQSFGMQVIIAAPLERCEYLVPRVCTSLVLSDVGETVLIEPYRNYDARLEALQ